MNEVVKYNNDFNLLPMPELSGTEWNILAVILAHSNHIDPATRAIKLNPDEFIKLSEFAKNQNSKVEFSKYFEKFSKKILNFTIKTENEKYRYYFVCFEKLKENKDTGVFEITFQTDFYEMLMNYKMGFTRFELSEFVMLSGSYTKTIYRILKQFRTTGIFRMEWTQFRDILQIPENMEMGAIDRQILKPTIKQLSTNSTLLDQKRVPFKGLTYKKIKGKGRGRGGTVIGIEFKFEKQGLIADEAKKINEIRAKQAKEERAERIAELEHKKRVETDHDIVLEKLEQTIKDLANKSRI